MDTLVKGYLYIIGAALLWATSGTAGKKLINDGLTAFDLVQVRVIVSSLLLAGAFLVRRRNDLFRIRLSDVVYFVVLGGVILSVAQISYFYAIGKIQTAAAILLQYLAPVLVAMYSICFWKERLTIPKFLALVLSMGGCFLMVGAYNLQLLEMNRAGIVGGLISAAMFAAYTLLGERGMHRYSPWTVLFYSFIFAGISLLIFHSPLSCLPAVHSLEQVLLLLHISVAGTLLAFGFYLVGINYLRSTRATITATLEPIAAGILAYFFLGETLAALQLFGGALVVAAIVLLQRGREVDEMAPEVVRKDSQRGRRV